MFYIYCRFRLHLNIACCAHTCMASSAGVLKVKCPVSLVEKLHTLWILGTELFGIDSVWNCISDQLQRTSTYQLEQHTIYVQYIPAVGPKKQISPSECTCFVPKKRVPNYGLMYNVDWTHGLRTRGLMKLLKN